MKQIIDDSVLKFDEIMNVVAKWYSDMSETVLINDNKIDCYILNTFFSNHIVIRNHYYLLLLQGASIKTVKILVKPKRNITILIV